MYHFSRIIFEPRAREERNHSKPRAKEERNINSNLIRKRREVIWSSITLNLIRKRDRASIHQESQTSCERGKEYHFESRAEEKRSYKTTKNSRPRAKEDQSILIHEEKKNIKIIDYLESRAKKNSNYKVHQKILNPARNRGRISGIIVVENLEWVR